MIPINEYTDTLINAKRYEIMNETNNIISKIKEKAKNANNDKDIVFAANDLLDILKNRFGENDTSVKELEKEINNYNNETNKIKKHKIVNIILALIIAIGGTGYIISKKNADRKRKNEEKSEIILTNEYVSKKIKENKITSIENILAFQYNKFDIVDLTGSLKNKNEKVILLYKDDPDYFIVYRVSNKHTYYIELDYENGGTIEETGEQFITYYSNRITIPEEGLKVSSNGTLV